MRIAGHEVPEPPERLFWNAPVGIGSDGAFAHWTEDPDVRLAEGTAPHDQPGRAGQWRGWNRYLMGEGR